MDCSLAGSSIHGISQTRILEWAATSFSRGPSQPRDRTWISCTAGRFCTISATRQGPVQLEDSSSTQPCRLPWKSSINLQLCLLFPGSHIQGSEQDGIRKYSSQPRFSHRDATDIWGSNLLCSNCPAIPQKAKHYTPGIYTAVTVAHHPLVVTTKNVFRHF